MVFQKRTLSLLAALVFAACHTQGNSPERIQADVTKAETEGQAKIADAEAKLAKVRQEASDAPVDANTDRNEKTPTAPPLTRAQKIADAEYEVEKAKAQQTYDVALARCGDRVGYAYRACKDQAASDFNAAMASAKAKNDEAHRPDVPEPVAPGNR